MKSKWRLRLGEYPALIFSMFPLTLYGVHTLLCPWRSSILFHFSAIPVDPDRPVSYELSLPVDSCVMLSSMLVPFPSDDGRSGISPVTASRMTRSQRCFSSSDSAAKLWTDLDWERRKLAGGSVGRGLSSTQ